MSSPAGGPSPPMTRIVCWNVASWATTAALIREAHRSPTRGIGTFLDRTGAALVCLQETKVTHKRLFAEPYVCGASEGAGPKGKVPLAGWESFWASNVMAKGSGFNGVAVYARPGVVLYADGRPLREAELDDEGRSIVVITRHFALFNVYVPFVRGEGPRSQFKKRFLDALVRAMVRVRSEFSVTLSDGSAAPMPVILCGDLNMACFLRDRHWTKWFAPLDYLSAIGGHGQSSSDGRWWRSSPLLSAVDTAALPHQFVRYAVDAEAQHQTVRRLAPYLHHHLERYANQIADALRPRVPPEAAPRGAPWPEVLRAALEALGEVVFETTDALTGLNFEQCDGIARVAADAELRWAEAAAAAGEEAPEAGHSPDYVPGRGHRLTSAAVAVSLVGVLGYMPQHLDVFRALLGLRPPASILPPAAPRLVDAFTAAYPSPHHVFTCWDQSKNGRQENFGSRIDYILVDEALQQRLISPACPSGFVTSTEEEPEAAAEGCLFPCRPDVLSANAAGDRVRMRDLITAGGLFPAAPMSGTGMPPVSTAAAEVPFLPQHRTAAFARAVREGAQEGLAAQASIERFFNSSGLTAPALPTGLFNTPPQYSDHCGLVAVLNLPLSALTNEDGGCPAPPAVVVGGGGAAAAPAVASNGFSQNTVNGSGTCSGSGKQALVATRLPLQQRERAHKTYWTATRACQYYIKEGGALLNFFKKKSEEQLLQPLQASLSASSLKSNDDDGGGALLTKERAMHVDVLVVEEEEEPPQEKKLRTE